MSIPEKSKILSVLIKRSKTSLVLIGSAGAGKSDALSEFVEHLKKTDDLQIGDKMPDGTVYAGISPDTNWPMYATSADASLAMKFNDAQEYAAKLDAHGHKDWRVPTKAELNVLFNNRAAIGGFDISGSDPNGWYWSLSQWKGYTWGKRFSDGWESYTNTIKHSSVRPVR